jgi:hypothetical protein
MKSLSEDSSPGMWRCIVWQVLLGVVSPFFFFYPAFTTLVSLSLLIPEVTWSHTRTARRRDLYLTTLTTDNHPCRPRDSNPQYKSDLLDSWKWRQFDALQCQWTTCRELYSDLSVCISDGQQMVHTRPQHSYHWHLSVWPTATPRVVPRRRINWCQVPVTRRWHLASRRRLLKNRFSDWLHATAERLWPIHRTVPILNPVISIYLDPLRSTWLASDLQQTSTWSKLSPSG